MAYVELIQDSSWLSRNSFYSAYSRDNCCQCGKPVGHAATLLMVTRNEGGDWFIISPDQDSIPNEKLFERGVLPIGPECLKKHPEYSIGLIK